MINLKDFQIISPYLTKNGDFTPPKLKIGKNNEQANQGCLGMKYTVKVRENVCNHI